MEWFYARGRCKIDNNKGRMRRLSLQFITHSNDRYSYLDSVKIALDGGCRWVQLRMKGVDDIVFCKTALVANELCKSANATFILDDRAHLVNDIGADGVHLGKNDMSIAEARTLLGKDVIIGGTANTIEDVVAIFESGADYIGCGPFRFTTTKKNLSPQLGLEGYAAIIKEMREQSIDIPIVAIGGIAVDDINDLARIGMDGIALSSSVLNAADPVAEMKKVVEKCNNTYVYE